MTHRSRRRRSPASPRVLSSLLIALALFAGACGSDSGPADGSNASGNQSGAPAVDPPAGDLDDFEDEEVDEEEFEDEAGLFEDDFDDEEDDEFDDQDDEDDEAFDDEPGPADDLGGPDRFPGGGVDLTKTRDDIDCSEEALGSDDRSVFISAHYVVDADLGEVCFGQEDPRLITAWETLAAITPPGQLLDLALFAAFESTESGDETTLAFVNIIDDAGSIFQMSVNLDAGEEDPNELMLTMAHEFSHVFTALVTQLDRTVFPEDCDTYDNGEGCYEPDSLMAEWIELFWADFIDEVDPESEATAAGGEERCDLDPGFLGAYAASTPEEDFAESFSAFVFQLPVDTPELQAKLDWFAAQPGLVEFQERATEANLGELENNFDLCG